MNRQDDPWEIEEWAFPEIGTVRAKLEFIVRYAILAPSPHNTQPWLFHVERDALDIFADRRRMLPIVDPRGRELTIACGAAIETARIALQHFGHIGLLELQPDARRPDLLARLRLGPKAVPSAENERLFAAITQRRTTRLAFHPPVDDPLLADCGRLAQAQHVQATAIVSPSERQRVAGLVGHADRVQMGEPAFRHELAEWVRSSLTSADGISLRSFGIPDVLSGAGALILRTFDIGEAAAGRDDELVKWSPALLLLSTPGDNVRDWLGTGLALARVTLRTTAAQVSSSYLNQPIEVAPLRPLLAEAAGVRGYPQILLRLGRAHPMAPAPRRPAYAVLLE